MGLTGMHGQSHRRTTAARRAGTPLRNAYCGHPCPPTYFRSLTPVTAPAGPPVPPPNAGALEPGTAFTEITKNQD